MKALVITRPVYEVEMFGGPATVTIQVGTRVRIHPANDLFMRGAIRAEVRSWSKDGCSVRIRPEIMGVPLKGKLYTIPTVDLLIDEKGI